MKLLIGIIGLIWKVYIAIIFMITALLFYPVLFPMMFSDAGRKVAFRVFVIWSWVVRILCFYHVSKKMEGALPNGPYIVIANHSSYLDIFLMPSILPNHRFLFLGKSEILKYPLIKTFFKRMNIPVYRGNDRKSAKSMIKAMREVKKGWSLVIFPEGGIPNNDSPRMIPFKNGAFKIAINTKAPIIPVTFLNNHLLFSDPEKILGPAHPGICRVIIHNTIFPDRMDMTEQELSDYCHDIIYSPLKERYAHLRD